jgi:hypothetical protein
MFNIVKEISSMIFAEEIQMLLERICECRYINNGSILPNKSYGKSVLMELEEDI